MGGLRGIDMFRKIPADLTSATTTGAILSVAACVEINQCVRATLAPSSGEDPTSPRHTFTTVGLIDAVAHKVLKAGKQL